MDAGNRVGGRLMRWWMETATELQRGVKADEVASEDWTYTEEKARQAAVHTRLDLVLVVSLLNSANHFLASIRFWLIVLTLVAILGIIEIIGTLRHWF